MRHLLALLILLYPVPPPEPPPDDGAPVVNPPCGTYWAYAELDGAGVPVGWYCPDETPTPQPEYPVRAYAPWVGR